MIYTDSNIMESIVLKPWGSYQVIEKGLKYIIKRITVKPKGILSLQSHLHRSEHWVIVKGIAEVVLDTNIVKLKTNEHIFIPKQTKHRLTNNEDQNLIVIEVWFGDILDEEDITRYEDVYNRK